MLYLVDDLWKNSTLMLSTCLEDPNNVVSLATEDDIFPTENGPSEVIRLAHFSVQEYLVSQGIKDSKASKFGIIGNLADPFIVESCLQYIFYYDESDLKTTSMKDLESFPLLGYACRYWYIHTKANLPGNQKLRDFF